MFAPDDFEIKIQTPRAKLQSLPWVPKDPKGPAKTSGDLQRPQKTSYVKEMRTQPMGVHPFSFPSVLPGEV